ncbi:MAG: hypothetical protein C4K48_09435 [Candidatus Thorarchaeota archaeon]|nr:MAG: hypothetical protein C4K48_09435 [Candidatus Thorarchaeota archaeon]
MSPTIKVRGYPLQRCNEHGNWIASILLCRGNYSNESCEEMKKENIVNCALICSMAGFSRG